MNEAEQKELQACLRRASEILYHNTPMKNLQTFEDLEITVREQVLEYVTPEIAFFLSNRKLALIKEEKET